MSDETTKTDHGTGLHHEQEIAYQVVTLVHHRDRGRIGRRRALVGDAVELGRNSRALGRDLFNEERVSRHHARLEPDDDGVLLRDLGSRNGTLVNGERVDARRLETGDIVQLGSSLLLFHRGPLAFEAPKHPRLLGISHAMARLIATVETVAAQDVSVLIRGESGCGKELVAHELHRLSGCRGELVALNCGAVSDGVIHSELFGHVKGAFSGAGVARSGLVEAAAEGSLFLDEIGDAPPSLQTSLLRLLEQGEYRPVGSDRSKTSTARFIAATHVPLDRAVAEGRFRHDLLTRLERWPIDVPPLRERREDIVPIALRFADAKRGAPVVFRRSLAHALLEHDWPGNVRELKAVVEVAVVEAGSASEIALSPTVAKRLAASPAVGDSLRPSLPSVPPAATPSTPSTPRRSRPQRPSREHLRERFLALGGSVTELADELGVSRNTLYRWFQELDLDLAELRDSATH
jgi:DNA-binding NtrC family response regulator